MEQRRAAQSRAERSKSKQREHLGPGHGEHMVGEDGAEPQRLPQGRLRLSPLHLLVYTLTVQCCVIYSVHGTRLDPTHTSASVQYTSTPVQCTIHQYTSAVYSTCTSPSVQYTFTPVQCTVHQYTRASKSCDHATAQSRKSFQRLRKTLFFERKNAQFTTVSPFFGSVFNFYDGFWAI